ncbi:RICIN domain-containing protein [Streptomyces sp. NPDC091280]|uniref:RICIN domain-containing protein n=1 Tax=Streptomyces sp. NPDC091280 TaxID=3365984 RepID=UPI003830F616
MHGGNARSGSGSEKKVRRGLLAMAVAVGAFCATTTGMSGSAQAAPAVSVAANKCLHKDTFQNFSGLKYMNDAGYGGKGAWVITSQTSGRAQSNEVWCIEKAKEGGVYFHPSFNTSLCMDVPGAKYKSGVGLVIWTCNGRKNQRFTTYTTDHRFPGTDGLFILPVASSSIYLNLTGGGYDTQVKLGGPKYPQSLWE